MFVRWISKKIYYGWVLVVLGHILMAVSGGSVYYAFGVFLKPMALDLHWQRGVTATAFSIMILVMGCSGPLFAYFIKHFGLRLVMGGGSILLVVTTLLMSAVTEAWQLYMVYGLLSGLVMGATTFLALTTMVNYWFIRRRSLAMGIVIAGPGTGTLALAPLSSYFIGLYGWRIAWLILAAVVLLFAALPVLLLVRNRPEDIGTVPDGDSHFSGSEKPLKNNSPVAQRDWTLKEALKTVSFWLLVVLMCANFFVVNIMTAHQVAHLTDIGISQVAAAGVLGWMVFFSAGARIIGGALGDRFSMRKIAVIACLMEVVALIILIRADTIWLIYIYLVIFGTAYGLLNIIPPAIVSAYYGRENFAAIFSMLFMVGTVSGAIGPSFAGFTYDISGNYLMAFMVSIVLCGVAAVCSLFARPPLLVDKNK